MERTPSIFDIFGGIRPMARAIGEPPSNVAAWKRVGRIPADKQPVVLQKADEIGLAVTAEHVVFPLGQQGVSVCFNGMTELKREPKP
jgi:hypothetical protein